MGGFQGGVRQEGTSPDWQFTDSLLPRIYFKIVKGKEDVVQTNLTMRPGRMLSFVLCMLDGVYNETTKDLFIRQKEQNGKSTLQIANKP